MIKISFGLAIRLLVDNKYKFIIEKVEWPDEDVYRFVVSSEYPTPCGHINMHSEPTKLSGDRIKHSGTILVYYDLQQQSIVGCTPEVLQMFKKIKAQAVEARAAIESTKVLQLS